MRQLFRKEYAKELEDTQLALDAQPGFTAAFSSPPQPAAAAQFDVPTTETNNPHIEMSVDATPSAAPPHDGDNKPKGFWGSLFKRKK
jgi:hypothetical protein